MTPKISVIMPVYNVERYVERSIKSVLAQKFKDFEFLIVDDGGNDKSIALCQAFKDSRIRIIHQKNRGLAGARNTGIRHAKGEYIALIDSDDLWTADKLERHYNHLRLNPKLGVSYSASAMIDENDKPLGITMAPRLTGITKEEIFCRNPIGNGSAPMMRKQVFNDIAFSVERDGKSEKCYFDETFRYGEDIECWMRIACTTHWSFEGLGESLTLYRIVTGGLSANTTKMYEHWCRMYEKVAVMDPDLVAKCGARARAYQIRYYARRSVKEKQGKAALKHFSDAIRLYPRMLIEEPTKTIITAAAAAITSIIYRSPIQKAS